MIHFTTFFALVVGGMGVIQPVVAGVAAGLLPRINLGLMNTFQRRQGAPPTPPQCANICSPVNSVISGLQSSSCSPGVCCVASFETSFFNCFTCAQAAVNDTDYTSVQSLLDLLYDECAGLGIQLPVLTFPGQNPNRPLSSVVLPISTVSSIASGSLTSQPITQTTIGTSSSATIATANSTTSAQATDTSSNTPTPTPSSASSGIRSMETSCFNLITAAMMLGTWFFYFAGQIAA